MAFRAIAQNHLRKTRHHFRGAALHGKKDHSPPTSYHQLAQKKQLVLSCFLTFRALRSPRKCDSSSIFSKAMTSLRNLVISGDLSRARQQETPHHGRYFTTFIYIRIDHPPVLRRHTRGQHTAENEQNKITNPHCEEVSISTTILNRKMQIRKHYPVSHSAEYH